METFSKRFFDDKEGFVNMISPVNGETIGGLPSATPVGEAPAAPPTGAAAYVRQPVYPMVPVKGILTPAILPAQSVTPESANVKSAQEELPVQPKKSYVRWYMLAAVLVSAYFLTRKKS